MPWVRFDKAFDFRHKPRVMQHFPAGQTVMVTTPCAEAAQGAGAGSIVKRPAGKKTLKTGQTVDE